MKILMPYRMTNNNYLESTIMTGGIERFSQLVYQNIPNVIPVSVDRNNKNNDKIIVKAAREHNVDVIFSNDEQPFATIKLQKELPDLPMMMLSHNGGSGLPALSHTSIINQFTDNGGKAFMVSKHQFEVRNKISKRVHNRELKISGFINSSFCSGNEYVSESIEFPVITCGRFSKEKNSFWLHKKCSEIDFHSVVLTNMILLNEANKDYFNRNKDWSYPQETVYDQTHEKVLDYFSKSGVYVSTCLNESWGITAMESLSHGCFLIILTDSSSSHASEIIPACSNHYFKIKSSIKSKEFFDLIVKNQLSYNQRKEISEMTKEKHSKEKWCKSIVDALTFTIETFKKPKYTDFFNL